MKLFSSIKILWKLLISFPILTNSIFQWEDFSFPTTLQLSPLIDLLLAPIECKRSLTRLKLGLQEALVNAVQHGNAGDPRKSLRIRRILTPNWFIWQIQDQGNGVPLNKRLGELPLELDSENGRGLFIICQCFDDVRWSRKGNRLQLACRRESLVIDEDSPDPLLPS